MAAILMFIFIDVIAISAFVYFYFENKKVSKRH